MFKSAERNVAGKTPAAQSPTTSEIHERLFMRPGTIEEEPDSVDSIISNSTSLPITIVPAALFRSSTQASFSGGRFSRQNSTRWEVVFDEWIEENGVWLFNY